MKKYLRTLIVLISIVLEAKAESLTSKYNDFCELKMNEVEGRDYQILIRNQGSPYSILAIHGGLIEPTTSEIALKIASNDLNYYLFEGIKSERNWDLHISSHLFDEPRALALTTSSKLCVSVHGFANKSKKWACLGGLNAEMRKSIFENLLSTGLLDQSEENPCNNYWASTKENIVNRCREGGVQIEISTKLRDFLRDNDDAMAGFANAVRRGIHDFTLVPLPTISKFRE